MIERFQAKYREALEAKREYEAAISKLSVAGSACQQERDAITRRLKQERPDLVAELRTAYSQGERIKDQMQMGGRWPKSKEKRTRYSQILEDTLPEQRSPELIACLNHWLDFERILKQIEELYPPPEHFHWNGAKLVGPNLYTDFGIVGTQ